MLWIRYILLAFALLQSLTEAQRRKTTGKPGRKRNQVERRPRSDGPSEHMEETEDIPPPHWASGGEGGERAHRHGHQVQCSTCFNNILQIRRERRIEEIKDRVLTATGLGTPPDMTGVVLTENPNIQTIIHEMEKSAPPHSFRQKPPYDDDDPAIKREKIFSPVEPGNIYASRSAPPGLRIPADMNALYFKLDLGTLLTRVKRAILHVWLKPMRSELDRQVSITVYKIYRINNTDFLDKTEVTTLRKEFDALEGNWVKIPVYKLLQEWLSKPDENLGLVVEALDSQGRQVAVTDPTESPKNAPLLEIHTEENRRGRGRRNSGSVDCTNNDTEKCCRYPLSVNFVEMGWDFIVAPKVYDANFCNGECPYLYAQKYAHSALVQKMNSSSAKHGPCCGARKLSPMKMLYYDHDHKIKFDTIQDMVVDRCGCS
uniref:Myostatin n=1 Tax=Palaemon carinicauda TaxID=392227 RepID=A0A385XRV9_PALCI|nr:myostatin [Palaemon carinicauda]